MAEKNFKITGGLALGDYALTANGLSLLWDSNAIALQSYVDSAVAGATVNTNAIAASLASSTLYVDSGDNLNVNVNAFVDTIDGSGLYVSGNVLVVNVNAFVDTIDGSGLYVSNNQLAVNTNVIATKGYVDSVAQGLDVKASVLVATTTNVNLASDLESVDEIDGTSLFTGARILVKNQTTLIENGIYIVSESGAPTRAADANELETDLTIGSFTFVETGTVNGGKGFVVTDIIPSGPGSRVVWSQFSEAGSLTAGTGIYISSGSINVNTNAIAEKGYVDTKVNTMFNLTGSGLYSTGGGSTLAVNTNAVASALASSTLYVDSGDNLNVNVNAFVDTIDGSGLYVNNNTLAVNANAVAASLASISYATGLYFDSSNNLLSVNVNTLTGTGLVNNGSSLSLDEYAAGVRYDGTSGSGGNASVTTDTFYATTESSNTYVTVGTIPMSRAFTLDVFMKTNGGTSRRSTVAGLTGGNTGDVEYTEYAIVDSATAITAPDIFIEWNAPNSQYDIKAKATLDIGVSLTVVIESTIIG